MKKFVFYLLTIGTLFAGDKDKDKDNEYRDKDYDYRDKDYRYELCHPAIPEPSTYAALVAVGAFACIVVISRKREK